MGYDVLKEAAVKVLDALDLPGAYAPASVAARLGTLAHNYEARAELMAAEIVLRSAVEGRRDVVHVRSPWREPGMSLQEKWLAVAITFPSLRDCIDIREAAFDTLVARCGTNEREGIYGAGKGHAVRFVLSLFQRPGWPAFDVAMAMGRWDEEHRGAFAAWASDPWWP